MTRFATQDFPITESAVFGFKGDLGLCGSRIVVSDESIVIWDNYTESLKHFFFPISREQDIPSKKFFTLKAQWENETVMLSSATEIAMHPAYQKIIGMGDTAIPFILNEMQKKPGHWFWALKSITGEDPVLPEQRGRVGEMTEAWLHWGKDEGYL